MFEKHRRRKVKIPLLSAPPVLSSQITHESMEGKVIAITGAGSGIGAATARILAAHGALLSLCDIDPVNLDLVLKDLDGAGHIATQLDVSDSDAVNAWIEKTVASLGRLDGAANVAGLMRLGGTETLSDKDWDTVNNVNIRGVFYCLRAELNRMAEGGSIVNVASIAGLFGLPQASAYVASKHAVVGLTKSTANEVGHRGIRVNAVAPGFIETPLLRGIDEARNDSHDLSQQALKRLGRPEEVARVIEFLLDDKSSFVTGALWAIDGGWSA